MSDPRNDIQAMFDVPKRFAFFGNVLTQIQVTGVRCHKHTVIDIESPITAFCGLNGTGKSTLLQLAAVAYSGSHRTYYIRDFMVLGELDPAPFESNASVTYSYWQEDRTVLTRTLSRKGSGCGWNYPQRQPRRVLFAGIGGYLPKMEQRDFVFRKANKLVIARSAAVAREVKDWICKVLSCAYEDVITNTVTYTESKGEHSGEVATVRRQGATYSEAHMGFGEGRTQYLIASIEALPPQSLVLVEEPETSLHPSAQYQLGQYFLDVVKRKHHQILLTTHSEYMLSALPAYSRQYLACPKGCVEAMPRLSAAQIHSLLSEGHSKALDVLVEDRCASAMLRELVRQIDPSFLQSVGIHPVGSWTSIVATVEALCASLPIAGVLDGDQRDQTSKSIFRLPGNGLPPEKLLFGDEAVKTHVDSTYRISLADFEATLTNIDHHGWFERLATRVNQDADSLMTEAARAYAQAHHQEAMVLTEQLKDTLR